MTRHFRGDFNAGIRYGLYVQLYKKLERTHPARKTGQLLYWELNYELRITTQNI